MRRRKATVELFEEIRRDYEFGTGTIAGVARKFGVHRRLVREALTSAIDDVSLPLLLRAGITDNHHLVGSENPGERQDAG